jgi:hypothetical protein
MNYLNFPAFKFADQHAAEHVGGRVETDKVTHLVFWNAVRLDQVVRLLRWRLVGTITGDTNVNMILTENSSSTKMAVE